MECLFHSILQGDIAILEIAVEGSAPHTVLIVLEVGWGLVGILAHGLIGGLVVKVPDAFYVGIGQYRTAMVADHGCCIAVPTGEDGQPAALIIHSYQRLHHVGGLLWSYQGVERMKCAIGVPHREVAIELSWCWGRGEG